MYTYLTKARKNLGSEDLFMFCTPYKSESISVLRGTNRQILFKKVFNKLSLIVELKRASGLKVYRRPLTHYKGNFSIFSQNDVYAIFVPIQIT